MIKCTKCKIEKDNYEYYKFRTTCKKCSRDYCRVYKKKNKEKISEYNKKYKTDNKIVISEYNKKYNLENRITIQKRHTKYLKDKRENDPKYKLALSCRNRIKKLLKGSKSKSTQELLDCDFSFFKEWLEFQLYGQDILTLENHGNLWHLDHVIPCNKFDLDRFDEIQKCFNWSNIQPLDSISNLSKKDTLCKKEIDNHIKVVKQFLKNKKLENKITIIDYDLSLYTN